MIILIINTHSVLNSGDSGILLAQIDFLQKYFKKVDISLISRTPAIDQKSYKDRVTYIFSPLVPAPSVFSGKKAQLFESLKCLFSIKSKVELISKIKKCDLVISSGGGYFWTNRKWIPGPMFFQNYIHVRIALLFKRPVMFFPQSIGPFFNRIASNMMSGLLSHKRTIKIFTREMISYQSAKKLVKKSADFGKIELCPDMALLLGNKPFGNKSDRTQGEKGPVIALTLRKWDFPGSGKNQKQDYNRKYLAQLEKFSFDYYHSHRASFVIFPQSRGPGSFENDRMISKTLFSRLKKRIPASYLFYHDLPDDTSPLKIIDLLSGADIALTTRLHSALFAFISGTPAVSIAYQYKSEGIMKEMGFGEFCLDINKIDSEEIKRMVAYTLKNKDKIRMMISKRLMEMRSMIRDKLTDSLKLFQIQ
jgi:polysaccharide pyruvyl transferase WcaK-like protein